MRSWWERLKHIFKSSPGGTSLCAGAVLRSVQSLSESSLVINSERRLPRFTGEDAEARS